MTRPVQESLHSTSRQPGFRATIVIASLISRSQSQPEAVASA